MKVTRAVSNLVYSGTLLRDAIASGNVVVLARLLGPAWRGLVRRRGRSEATTPMPLGHDALFDWRYQRDHPEMARLYEAAKGSQWDAAKDLDWSIDVDPLDPERPLLPDDFMPVSTLPYWSQLTAAERARQRHVMMAWLLSQFLHGEQGALFAAAQVTQAVPWMDAKLYGSSQVVDEGRHVEVFHAYLTRKLGLLIEINDNLYVVVDSLMSDGRWDMKFLGMQIMIEGLALGAFGMLRQATQEPLLKQLLGFVITDEARHVHYGVLALSEYLTELGERERREREDWAFEVALMLRNRFLAHEFYDAYYADLMTPRQWDDLVRGSRMMGLFRHTMFKRIVPNLRRIGLLGDRIRPRYAELGLLEYEKEPSADRLTAKQMLEA